MPYFPGAHLRNLLVSNVQVAGRFGSSFNEKLFLETYEDNIEVIKNPRFRSVWGLLVSRLGQYLQNKTHTERPLLG